MILRPAEAPTRVRPVYRDLGLIQIASVTAASSNARYLGHAADIDAPPAVRCHRDPANAAVDHPASTP